MSKFSQGKSARSKPDRQRQQTCRQATSSIGVPQTRTLRLWAKLYFDRWAAADSDMAGSLQLLSKSRGSWTYETILNFFKTKDLEFKKLSGKKVVQLHIKIMKVSRSLIMKFQGRHIMIASTSVAIKDSSEVLRVRKYSSEGGNPDDPKVLSHRKAHPQASRIIEWNTNEGK